MKFDPTFFRRHSPNRRKTRMNAVIEFENQTQEVVILDVSYDGMKLSVPDNIAPGTAVMIHVLDEKIPAIVHWSKTHFAGLHLLKRLKSSTLHALEMSNDELAKFR